MIKNFLKAVLLLLPLAAFGKTDSSWVQPAIRPVISAYTLELGSAHIAQTYLSPLRHGGFGGALSYERMQAMRFKPERWVMRLGGRLDVAKTHNLPAKNATLWNLGFCVDWGMMHRWNLHGPWQGRIQLMGGGYTAAEAGMYYLPRNSNNPVAARGAWTLGVMGAAVYNGTVHRMPFCLRYLAQMPLTGVFFAPEYGELYYEIYLGNHRNLVRGAWPGNFFRLNNLLTVDLRAGATIVRLGYRCGITSTKASHNVSRHIDHMFVFGLASEWVSLSAKRDNASADAKIISAMY